MQSSEIKAFLQLGQMTDNGEFQPYGMKETELDVCSFAFIRGMNGLGKIGTDLRGGNISFVSTKIPSAGILEWGVKSSKYYSGCISFRDAVGKSQSRLFFQNAACVNLKISYENEGVGYLMAQGALQAEILTLDGTSPYENRWKNHADMDTSYNASSDAVNAAADFFGVVLNSEASLGAKMTLGGREYELRSFEMEFAQELEPVNGEPQTSVRGGLASISLFEMPTEHLNKWLTGADGVDGMFRFGDERFGYPLKISFTEARCAGFFAQCMNNSSQNVITRLNIAPRTLSLNGIDYTNYSV